MRLSTFASIGGALLVGALGAAPAFAGGQGSISGSATFITPATFTTTVSAESVLAPGFLFPTAAATLTAASAGTSATLANSQVLVAPAIATIAFSPAVTSLSVGSSIKATSGAASTSFSAAAATVLANSAAALSTGPLGGRSTATFSSNNIDFIAAIIKAGAGVNGLD